MKIAFGDKSRVGKDTAVDYYIKKFGGKRFSISNYLYDIMMYVQKKCNLPLIKDRKFLQIVGTEWGRNCIDNNLWINLLLNDINKSIEDNNLMEKNIYISDVRFRNEFDILKSNNWILIKIKKNVDPLVVDGFKNHSSEDNNIKDDEWDFVIENNKSMDEFEEELNKIYDKLVLGFKNDI
jgi:hypothetical protein